MVDREFIPRLSHPRIDDAPYPTVAYATDERGVSSQIRGMNPTATIERPDGACTVFVT